MEAVDMPGRNTDRPDEDEIKGIGEGLELLQRRALRFELHHLELE